MMRNSEEVCLGCLSWIRRNKLKSQFGILCLSGTMTHECALCGEVVATYREVLISKPNLKRARREMAILELNKELSTEVRYEYWNH